jgi:hypothetical protein
MMGLDDEFDGGYDVDLEDRPSGYRQRFDPGIEGMQQAYETWGQPKVVDADFEELERLVADVEYDSEDIYGFCERADLEYANDGWFVSALVNQADEEEITLPDMTGVESLGRSNRKTIVIEGNVGRWVGNRMEEGTIVVQGYAGREFSPGIVSRAGEHMKGGEIYVEGFAESGKREGGAVYRRTEDGDFEPLSWKDDD